jgi:hypothetical protein
MYGIYKSYLSRWETVYLLLNLIDRVACVPMVVVGKHTRRFKTDSLRYMEEVHVIAR